jgi:hypothetical protein
VARNLLAMTSVPPRPPRPSASSPEGFVVTIYRRRGAGAARAIGTVEATATGAIEPFRGVRQLVRLLNGTAPRTGRARKP